MRRLIPRFVMMLGLFSLMMLFLVAPGLVAAEPPAEGGGMLTLLHNNDGESSLLPIIYQVNTPSGTVQLPVSSVAAYETVVEQNIAEATGMGHAVLNVYAGDAFLASATLLCSQPSPSNPNPPFYDAVAQRLIPYDAHIFGNHEFDYSPDFLERFIRAFDDGGGLDQPFLSANLDFSGEPGYAGLIDPDGLYLEGQSDGRVVARSAIVTATNGLQFGIVGATTPQLPTISTPRNVSVTANLTETAVAVQAEIDRLINTHAINRIIFVSHLQDVGNDRTLVGMLNGVDVAVAGGGDELLQNPTISNTIELLPGESQPVAGTYPLEVLDAGGRTVYIVTTPGNYKYVGRLDVEFDAGGEVAQVITADSYPRRVIPESPVATQLGLPDAVTPDPTIVTQVADPVAACLQTLATTVVATTTVTLDVSRPGVRTRETNAGNLITDGFLWAYDQLHAENNLPTRNGAPMPRAEGGGVYVVAFQNGGGIRQNAGDVLTGTISQLDTFNVLPFDNFVTVIGEVTPSDLKSALERSAASLPGQGGQFLQMAGLHVIYNTANPAGSRVQEARLDDGTFVIQAYAPLPGAPNVYVVTNSFTANGGDNYPVFASNPNKTRLLDNGVAITYEEAWREFMQTFPNDTIPQDPAYLPNPQERIQIVSVTAVTLGELGSSPASGSGWLVAALMLALGGTTALLGRRLVRR